MLDKDTYGAEGGRKSDSAAPPDDFIMRPRVDVCFKRLMEDEEVRTGFLSAILGIPPEEIKSVVLLPTGTLPEYGDDKLGILEVHVLELPKIKDGAYPESKLLHWAKFLNSNTRTEMKNMAVKDPYIEKAYRQVVKLSADEMARLEYEAREKAERDHDAYLKSSWLDGQKDGILFGMRILMCIQNSRQEGLSDRQIISRLSERFSLKEEEAEEYMKGIGQLNEIRGSV